PFRCCRDDRPSHDPCAHWRSDGGRPPRAEAGHARRRAIRKAAALDLSQSPASDDLIANQGDTIAPMLRGERQPLSAQERAKILRHRISYLTDDLVIPTWNAAFVYDTRAGAQAALEILELVLILMGAMK